MENKESKFRFFGQTYQRNNKSTIKDSARDFAISKVKKSGLQYESKFNDSFFIINGIKGKVEFYPGTGVFICKSTGYRGKGADNMIKYAKTGQTSF
jgi:hypothetical protein